MKFSLQVEFGLTSAYLEKELAINHEIQAINTECDEEWIPGRGVGWHEATLNGMRKKSHCQIDA